MQSLPQVSAQSGWRIEVQRRGRYWQWRKGRADNREARYGGKFELLTDERKAQYEENKAKRQKESADNGARSAATSGKRSELLSNGRFEREGAEWE